MRVRGAGRPCVASSDDTTYSDGRAAARGDRDGRRPDRRGAADLPVLSVVIGPFGPHLTDSSRVGPAATAATAATAPPDAPASLPEGGRWGMSAEAPARPSIRYEEAAPKVA